MSRCRVRRALRDRGHLPWWVRSALAIGSAVAALLLPTSGAAQGYRGEIRLGGHLLELRPLLRDSLSESEVPGDGLRRRLTDGTVVSCVPGEFCRWYGSGEVGSISVFTQELRIVGWPGMRGLSFHGHLRGRYGSDDFWPRSDQELEAVAAYVNWDQGIVRLRGGRQYRTDGLGYRNFDGASLLWRTPAPVRVELFGGWSLGLGLNAPRTGDLLSQGDEFAPDDRALLLGAEVTGYWGRRLSASAVYQREIRTDLLALYSERVAVDARALWGEVGLTVSAEYDLSFAEFNEVRLRIAAPLGAGLHATAEARHYTPFFELWTIWGAFTPVGFDEIGGSVAWGAPRGGFALRAGGTYRVYEETDARAAFAALEEDGWRAYGSASWRRASWFVEGGYRAEIGFGAARLGGDVRVGREFGRDRYVGLRGTSTQEIGELRLGEQRVTGGGFEGTFAVADLLVSGGAGLYRISFDNRPASPDWTQARGFLSLGFRFGNEPGLEAPQQARP